jgi:nitrate reductase NapAB chaperone NapD
MTVYRLGGWETNVNEQLEGELVVTIAYADTEEEPKTQEELEKTLRFLNVRMSFQQASEFGSQIWRRAAEQLRQAPPH